MRSSTALNPGGGLRACNHLGADAVRRATEVWLKPKRAALDANTRIGDGDVDDGAEPARMTTCVAKAPALSEWQSTACRQIA